jgi:phenylpropionate dioxygenase-like ring-hydroxylating dioxygenase large terminal subunit
MAFLKNAWYVACWSEDLKPGELLARKILGSDVLMFRGNEGRPVALTDRCPHRFIPLSMGRLVGETVECCYHGLRFDCTGRCVLNPHGDGKIPAAAQVPSYPMAERDGIVWIWMGDRDADVSAIPKFDLLDPKSGHHVTRGVVVMQVNYVLMGENLLDLSHVTFLHEGLLGNPGMEKTLPQVREEGGHLYVDRLMPRVKAPGIPDLLYKRDGRIVDVWQNVRWTPPSNYLIDGGICEPDGRREDGAWYFGVHLLTPETETSTHYHFAAARPPDAAADPDLDAELARLRKIAFTEQDKPIVEAQQAVVGTRDFWQMKPVLLPIDAGPVRMRRIIERLIANEPNASRG